MNRAALVLLSCAAAACGDDGGGTPDAPVGGDIVSQLGALPGVTITEWSPPATFHPLDGYRYFDLTFALPVDPDDASAGTFALHAALMHHDAAAPLVVYAGGYNLGWARYLTEPSTLTGANQLSLEYRFYGASIPDGGIPWAKLRVAKSGADEHAIVSLMKQVYAGPRIATGGSKGGENALLQHMLYPGDYAGVVAYVPPVITAFFDERYDGELDRIGVPACRTALRAAAREMLVRRAAMESRATSTGDTFEVAGVAHAVETGIVELEFSFWMTRGEPDCDKVPAPTASDDDLWVFLNQTSPPSGYADATLAESGTQYIYQDHVELGYPVLNHAYLDDLMQFSYEDWSAYLPPGEPHPYDPSIPIALADWVTHTADHVMLVGGEWDPWGAGYPPVSPGRDAALYLTPHGSHWSSGIYSLATADQQAALAQLASWVGASPRTVAPERPRASMASRGPVAIGIP